MKLSPKLLNTNLYIAFDNIKGHNSYLQFVWGNLTSLEQFTGSLSSIVICYYYPWQYNFTMYLPLSLYIGTLN